MEHWMVTVHGTCPRCKGTGYALDLAPATLDDALIARVASYLSTGGLFNPELAQHDNVRDLLIDLRDRIAALMAELEAAKETGRALFRAAQKAEAERDALLTLIRSISYRLNGGLHDSITTAIADECDAAIDAALKEKL
jgi:hypothetical protein